MAYAELLIHQASIERMTGSTQDSYGQPVQTWTVQGTVVCRVVPVKRGNAQIIGPLNQAVMSTHTAYLPAGTDVAARDRLNVAGTLYLVLFVRDAAGAGHHLEVDLELVEP